MAQWDESGHPMGTITEYGTRPAVSLHIRYNGDEWWFDITTWRRSL